jgi:hypothetical protein
VIDFGDFHRTRSGAHQSSRAAISTEYAIFCSAGYACFSSLTWTPSSLARLGTTSR